MPRPSGPCLHDIIEYPKMTFAALLAELGKAIASVVMEVAASPRGTNLKSERLFDKAFAVRPWKRA